MEIFSKELKMFTVLSLFTGICGVDLGSGGEVIGHKNSTRKDSSSTVSCTSNISGFVKLIPNNFEVVFQNDILGGAKNRISHNYNIGNIHDVLTDGFTLPLRP